jgi:hypothetical protein
MQAPWDAALEGAAALPRIAEVVAEPGRAHPTIPVSAVPVPTAPPEPREAHSVLPLLMGSLPEGSQPIAQSGRCSPGIPYTPEELRGRISDRSR